MGPEDHERLGIPAADPATIRVTNPLSADHSQLRRSLLPGLVRVLAENERQRRGDLSLFEVGHVHELVAGEPAERSVLGILLAGDQAGAAWNQPARQADFWEVRGLVTALCERLGAPLPIAAVAPSTAPYEHPGRTAVLAIPGAGALRHELGRVFELHPAYLEAAEVRSGHVAVAFINLDALESAVPAARRYVPFPRVPAVERDLAVVIGEGRATGDVEAVVRESAAPLLRELRVFDVYAGAPLADGERSLAFRLTLQAADRTLTDDDIDATMARVIVALTARLGARIRS